MADLVSVRCDHAASDSYGHVWAEAGAVVQMPQAEAATLPPGVGFAVVETPVVEPSPDAEVTEPAPADEHEVSEHPQRRGGRRPRGSS